MPTTSFTVNKKNAGRTLLEVMAEHLGLSRKKAKALLDQRSVFVNQQRVWMARHTLQQGDVVATNPPKALTPRDTKQLVYRDEHYLVANKPAGILSNGLNSLEVELRRILKKPGLRAVHRLDRDTSGCLVFATGQKAFEAMVEQFRKNEIQKVYRAIILGRMNTSARDIKDALEGRTAITQLRVLDSNPAASHIQVRLSTGRTHQIRKHLTSLGHPVVGDKKYGLKQRRGERVDLTRVPRQMLHASAFTFEHPFTGKTIRAKAPHPADFKRCLRDLKLR